MSKIKTVYIEGNIGSGKSTFLNIMKQHLDIQVIYEPHELWQNVGGHNLLQQFFLDQKRWSFTLQDYVMITRIDQLKEAKAHNHGKTFECVERSVFSGRYCFAQTMVDMGILSELEWALYKILWDRDVDGLVPDPAGFIYLITPASICYERIKQRGRTAENPVTLDYLKGLEAQHDDWLLHKKGLMNKNILDTPVLVLDNSKNTNTDEQIQDDYLAKIHQFFNTL